ncbi:MAG: hypothetical protein HY070_11535 [Chloroflexi bacterium]|nr:hypothetical protein [Chloroflexota bacterium]
MTALTQKYLRNITILFGISLIGLAFHALDDALVTREPDWYSIGVAEFLLYVALIYLIVPPIGLWLTRRNANWFGIVILAAYAFQAFYGAGLNHVRHLFGNFSGSQLLPMILNALGVNYQAALNQPGFWPVVMNMAGLGVTPPHTHTFLSNVIVFCNIGINIALGAHVFLLAREKIKSRRVSESPR